MDALGNFLIGAGLILGGVWLVLACIRSVPEGYVGIVTLFGKRTGQILPAGSHFLWPSFIEEAQLVNLDRDGCTLSEHTLLLPDGSQVALNVSLPWSPDPENILALVDAGDGDEVNKALAEIIEERLARWGSSEKEGPQTWREAIQSYQEVKQVISEAIGLEGDKIKQFGIVLHRVSVTKIKPLGELDVLLDRERHGKTEQRQAPKRTPSVEEEIDREIGEILRNVDVLAGVHQRMDEVLSRYPERYHKQIRNEFRKKEERLREKR